MALVLFTAQHHDNAPITRVNVEPDAAKEMAVFYRKMGFMVGIGEEPQRPDIRIMGQKPAARAKKPKLSVAGLQEIIAKSAMSAEDKIKLLQQLQQLLTAA